MKISKVNNNLDLSYVFQLIGARLENVDLNLKTYLESVLTQDNEGLTIYYVPDKEMQVWDGTQFNSVGSGGSPVSFNVDGGTASSIYTITQKIDGGTADTMAIQIQFRRDTLADWAAENPVLAEGEMGVEGDTFRYKIGDGVTDWNTLPYKELSPTYDIATYNSQLTAPTPNADELFIYNQKIANRNILRMKGPSGLDTSLQPALFGNGVMMYAPGTTTAPSAWGGPLLTHTGTCSHPVLIATTEREQTRRWSVVSATTVGAAAGSRSAFSSCNLGDGPGLGGFFVRFRFSIATNIATQQLFVGLYGLATAIAAGVTPSALLNSIALGYDEGDTNMQIMHNGPSGTATKIDLGVNFPTNEVDIIYDFTLFSAPNSGEISYQLTKITSGVSASGTITGSNLPLTTLFLAPHMYLNAGSSAGPVRLDMMRLYVETDY